MKNPQNIPEEALFEYGVLLTLQSIGTERRLSRLEASYKELEWRYRIDSNTLARTRLLGGVGGGRSILPPTRLGAFITVCLRAGRWLNCGRVREKPVAAQA